MSIAENIRDVNHKIQNAVRATGRSSKEVKLIAVSKNFSADEIRVAQALGLRNFGENYVQESLPKIDELKKLNLEWHFIGHLQSNKVKNIADQFDYIHSVDSAKLAAEISKKSTQNQKIFIEVNLASEVSKSGCAVEKLGPLLEIIQKLEHLQLCGLMFMAPLNLKTYEQQRFFAEARNLRTRYQARVSAPHSLVELSMGTSHDFEMAIKEGATMVRLGTLIFGERNYGR